MTQRFRFLFSAALALALVAGLGSAPAQAQSAPQVGYTDYELILVQMPQFRQVQQQLQNQAQADQQALVELQTTIEQRLQQKAEELEGRLQGTQGPVTESARERLLNELRQEAAEFEVAQRTELEQARQERMQNLNRREAELLQPLYEQLQTAINSVAEQRNLAFVISSRLSGEPVLLYAGPSAVDVTAEVMSQLGISMQGNGAGN